MTATKTRQADTLLADELEEAGHFLKHLGAPWSASAAAEAFRLAGALRLGKTLDRAEEAHARVLLGGLREGRKEKR